MAGFATVMDSFLLATAVAAIVVSMFYAPAVAQFYSISFGTEDPSVGGHSSSAPYQEIQQKVTPLDAMIDKTNHLGFRILHLHSKGNKNNIAFSPCAMASVLVALYEGAAGRSAAEIHDNLVEPYDKDVLRVGYRDIHRRLRSYFYQRENLLNGLSLSSENITIRPEYESVLKFYGYDLDNIPEMHMQTTTPVPTTSTESTEVTSEMPAESSELSQEEPSTTESATVSSEETVTEPLVEPTADTFEGSADGDVATTAEPTTTVASDDASTTPVDVTETTTDGEVTSETSSTSEGEPTDESTTAEGGEKRRRNLRKRGQRLTQVPGRPTQGPQSRRRSLRVKRQPDEIDIISHQRFLQNFLLQDVTTNSPLATFPNFAERTNQFQHDRLVDDTVEHNFYLSETEVVKVPYKIYNTILPHAYIERLQSTVVELELDSDDYKLLIILPDYEFGIGNVMKLLQIGENVPNLRDIVNQMAPTWVKTIVPKFNLKGNIILTSDLQNLGINDIFEPSRADFTLMTEDPLIYAKHIEQAININIRTHSLQQLKRFTSLYKNPVELAINYPFLFCILDKEMDLALIAGRILNPLNSRIH